jgi:transcriptional regulator with XRE-family HTH domain
VVTKKSLKIIFGSKLAYLMKKEKVKQGELAKLLGVHQTQIGKYVKGENFPDIEKWEKLAERFRVSPIFFVDDSSGIAEELEAAALYRERVKTLRETLRATEAAQVAGISDREIQDKLLDLREGQLSKLSMRI